MSCVASDGIEQTSCCWSCDETQWSIRRDDVAVSQASRCIVLRWSWTSSSCDMLQQQTTNDKNAVT